MMCTQCEYMGVCSVCTHGVRTHDAGGGWGGAIMDVIYMYYVCDVWMIMSTYVTRQMCVTIKHILVMYICDVWLINECSNMLFCTHVFNAC